MRRLTIVVVALAAFVWAAPAFATATFSGTITTNTTWNSTFPGTIELTDDVTIAAGATLTIDSGVTVLVDNGKGITVNLGGALVVNGTAAFPVSFTTATSPALAGNWKGIAILGTGSFTHALISYGGDAGLSVTGSVGEVACDGCALTVDHSSIEHGLNDGLVGGNALSFSLTDSSFTNNGHAGVHIEQRCGATGGGACTDAIVSGNTFTNNPEFAGYIVADRFADVSNNSSGGGNGLDVLLLSGALAPGSHTWSGNTITLAPALTIPTGSDLTLGPGQTFKNFDPNIRIDVSGSLTVNGTTGAPDTFTSIHDDSAGGDSDHAFPATPQPGDWGGIAAHSGATLTLHNTNIRYGSSATQLGAAHAQIECESCVFSADVLRVANGQQNGLGFSGGTPSLVGLISTDNGQAGLRVAAGTTLTASHLDLVGNAIGLQNAGNTTLSGSIVSGSAAGILSTAGSVSVDHSDVLGSFSGLPSPVGANGNIALGPQFVDAAARDLHLRATSPAIGAGGGSPATDMGVFQTGFVPLAISATGHGVLVGHGDVAVDVGVTGTAAGGLTLTAIVTGANPHGATALTATDGTGATSFHYTPTAGGIDTVTIFYDSNGNNLADFGEPFATTRVTVTADTDAPTPDVSPLPAITGECSATAPTPTAIDATATTTGADGKIRGATPDPTSYATQGDFTIHWSYDDGNGNVSHQDQLVSVHDTIAPVPVLASLPTISGAGTVAITTVPSATDNCAGVAAGTTSDPLSYSTPGTHVVHWTYSDGHGNSTAQTQNVVVDSPPHASAGTAQTVNEGATVTLDGSASSDPDPGDTLTYAWTQTSGAVVSLAGANTVHPTFVAPDNGTYAFQLMVTDSSGRSDTASVTITATNVNPTGTFTAPVVVDEGSTFTLALTSLSDVPADQPTLTTSFDCGAATVVGPGACRTGASGTIAVRGTVTDKDGGSTTYTRTVSVRNVAPTANAGGPYSGAAGTPIPVTGTATDPGLPGDVLTFGWDCNNDGTIDATGANATCMYALPGTYTAKLTVTDHDGGVGTATATVTVGLPASTATLITGAVRWSRGIESVTGIISDGHHFTLGVVGYEGDGRRIATATVLSVVVAGNNAVVLGRGVLIGHPLVTLSWRLDLHDGGNPGVGDTLRLRLSDGYDSGTLARVTGNLKIH